MLAAQAQRAAQAAATASGSAEAVEAPAGKLPSFGSGIEFRPTAKGQAKGSAEERPAAAVAGATAERANTGSVGLHLDAADEGGEEGMQDMVSLAPVSASPGHHQGHLWAALLCLGWHRRQTERGRMGIAGEMLKSCVGKLQEVAEAPGDDVQNRGTYAGAKPSKKARNFRSKAAS